MIPVETWLLFAGAALVMVLTPGPNMVHLIARSVAQGRGAGWISLAGVLAGFVFHMLAAAIGLYRRLGFRDVGRREGYYSNKEGRKSSALVMRRDLR